MTKPKTKNHGKATGGRTTKKASPSSKAAAHPTKKKSKPEAKPAKHSAVKAKHVDEPVMDRRGADGRRKSDRRQQQEPVAVERRKIERRVKVNRRRQIDPTTCERDYTDDELEFMGALDAYKRSSGRMFPTCSEVLEVLKKLGYQKLPVDRPAESSAATPRHDLNETSPTNPLAI